MSNKKEFLELIERYETIELDEIKAMMNELGLSNGFTIVFVNKLANALTGFSQFTTCTLCISIKRSSNRLIKCKLPPYCS